MYNRPLVIVILFSLTLVGYCYASEQQTNLSKKLSYSQDQSQFSSQTQSKIENQPLPQSKQDKVTQQFHQTNQQSNQADNLLLNPNIQNFMQMMVKKHDFTLDELRKIFAMVNLRLDLLDKMRKPYEAKPWYEYKQHLVTQQRIDEGVAYWREHRAVLRLAKQQYHVPTAIIVAILGVETMYGKIALKYPVLDTLTTLSFFYPERSVFFQSELENYLLLTKELQIKEQNYAPNEILGSYAGAIGFPQFMPSSYRRFAVNLDDIKANFKHKTSNNNYVAENLPKNTLINKKHLGNLINNHNDAILSIANYLKYFGWHSNELVALKTITTKSPKNLTNEQQTKINSVLQTKGLPTKYNVKFYSQFGLQPIYAIPRNTLANLLVLDNNNDSEYWLSFNNFYTISRYNGSKHYIMAVYELARAICKQVNCKERF